MQGKKILILDDEKEICFLLSALLRQMGHYPDQAYTINQAMNKFQQNIYDLVFLDLNLPDGLGHHLVPEIKRHNPLSKIIMISAHDGMLKQLEAEINDIDFYIYKPFNRKTISEAFLELNMMKEPDNH